MHRSLISIAVLIATIFLCTSDTSNVTNLYPIPSDLKRTYHVYHKSPKKVAIGNNKLFSPQFVRTWEPNKDYAATWKRVLNPVNFQEWRPFVRPLPNWLRIFRQALFEMKVKLNSSDVDIPDVFKYLKD